MTTFIVLAAVMALAAAAIIAWPLYRARRGAWVPVATTVLLFLLSGALYSRWSNWDWSGRQQLAPDGEQIMAMVSGLEQKLAAKPDDLQGWLMLGRSYMALERFDDASVAYGRARKLAGGQDAESALGLGEALSMQAGGQITPAAAGLFEAALKLAPQSPKALLFAGFAAASRGDKVLARSRWQMLKTMNPPPALVRMIDSRIAELDAAPVQEAAADTAGASATVTIRLAPALANRVRQDSVLFLSARVPAEPGPPLAVKRLGIADIGKPLQLSAADSMVPGKGLHQGQTVQVTARVSFSGQPLPSPGDLYGELTYNVGQDGIRELLIDRVAQ